jgi:predicted molibdopterin-dependent oxidoreductase YjgC
MSYPRLDGAGLQWPCPSPDHPGTPILHAERFTRGLGLFSAVEYRPPAESTDDDYPFLLSTGRILFHWHGGTLTRRSPGLDWLAPEAEVEVNPDDAAAMSVANGEMIQVRSRRGVVRARTKITSRSPRGTVFMTFHYAEAAANLLTTDAVDPVAKIPEYKVAAVRLERIAEGVPA